MAEQQHIAFRCDASPLIGTGHFMRCLTLAEYLKQQGGQIRFVCRELPEHLQTMLAAKGIEYAPIGGSEEVVAGDLAHSHWLPAGQEADAQATSKVLVDHCWDWLVVDHYALDIRWEGAVRPLAKRIMAIDDLADRKHDCDLLLDQNYYADMQSRYEGKTPAYCQLLLGPRYALLRDEFRELRKQVHPRTGEVKKILVFFGGADADNYTSLAIQALSELDIAGIQVDVVIGAQHPACEEIGQACATLGYHCHVQTSRMAALMAEADLAVGAGGSTTWERCCMGLPALSVCTAENQRRQIADAAGVGLIYAPSGEGDMLDMLRRHVSCLLENATLLNLISNAAMKAVDGHGALRIINEMGLPEMGVDAEKLYLRSAIAADAAVVWPWRNSESTRRYFFDPSPVSLDTHVMWWNRSLVDPQRTLLIGYIGERPFGVIRFDFEVSRSAVISIYIDPNMTNKGRGRKLLFAGLTWLRENHPETNSVSAEILPGNSSSLRVFQSAGFTEQYRVLVLNV